GGTSPDDSSIALCGILLHPFDDTAGTGIYTPSLHDALPILVAADRVELALDRDAVLAAQALVDPLLHDGARLARHEQQRVLVHRDRKSTRLNSSHVKISYAVFCLEKKKSSDVVTTLIRSVTG